MTCMQRYLQFLLFREMQSVEKANLTLFLTSLKVMYSGIQGESQSPGEIFRVSLWRFSSLSYFRNENGGIKQYFYIFVTISI